MRILHVVGSLGSEFGGPIRSIEGIAAAVPDADHAVCGILEGKCDTALPNRALQGFRIGPMLSAKPRSIKGVLRDFQPDVVHIHGALHPVYFQAGSSSTRRSIPLVVSPRSAFMLQSDAATHRRARRGASKRLVEQVADVVHLTSEDESAALGAGKALRVVIPNVVAGLDDLNDAPAQSNRSGSERGFLVLGRVSKRKNTGLAIEAWLSLPAPLREAHPLTIAGEVARGEADPVAPELRARAIRHGVRFAGHVDGAEKESLLNESRVLLHPSDFENFGHSIAEAMQAGLGLVLGPSTPFSPALMTTSGAVVVDDPRNVRDLASGMEQALAAHVDSKAMLSLLNNNTPSNLGPEYLSMYSSVAANG